jgi:hypothetical protein
VTDRRVPYSEDEAQEAWLWVGRHGPSNSWTASNGTAARMIGRLLEERERLLAMLAARDNLTPMPND